MVIGEVEGDICVEVFIKLHIDNARVGDIYALGVGEVVGKEVELVGEEDILVDFESVEDVEPCSELGTEALSVFFQTVLPCFLEERIGYESKLPIERAEDYLQIFLRVIGNPEPEIEVGGRHKLRDTVVFLRVWRSGVVVPPCKLGDKLEARGEVVRLPDFIAVIGHYIDIILRFSGGLSFGIYQSVAKLKGIFQIVPAVFIDKVVIEPCDDADIIIPPCIPVGEGGLIKGKVVLPIEQPF